MAAGDEFDLTRTHRVSPPGSPQAVPAGVGRWGDFPILGELGRGGFGRVYHAWDPTLARDIALKVVRLPDATEAAAALREGRMLARVRHRNVVTVYGAQQIGDEVGVWMELIRGRSLSQIVREQGPLGPEEATVVGISVCQALAAVHGAGLLHRDIKATNVMREAGGRIVLMDFGAGRETGPGAAGTDLAGTPVYMAPEVLDGGAASARSDLYSVGVLLFFAVTGDYPVMGDSLLALSLAHRRGERRLLADRRPDLPDGFIRAVERALAPSPADRPTSAGAMLRDLSNLPSTPTWETGRLPLVGGLEPSTGPVTITPGHMLGPGDTVAPARAGAAGIWIGALPIAGLGVGVLGFLTSAAFNIALGRDGGFSNDRAIDWWIYGVQSLVAPAILAAILLVGGRLVAGAWQLVRRARPVAAGALKASRGLGGVWRRLGGDSPAALSQWVVLLHALGLAWIGFAYRDLLGLLTTIGLLADATPEQLELLSPTHTAPLYYRALVTVVMVAAGAAWWALLSRPNVRPQIPRSAIVAGGAAMALSLLMLAVPWRLLYMNEMPRLAIDGERCYEVGARGTQVLLYCPDARAPRIRIAERPTLPDSGITVRESIFTQAPLPR